MTTTAQYLETLRRIPDDIVLSMAARPIEPWRFDQCICGWAAREAKARTLNVDATETEAYLADRDCTAAFGGEPREWADIFGGIVTTAGRLDEMVEEAFTLRVMEAAGVA